MNKPSAGPLSDLVRSCPEVSEMSTDKTRREVEERPPLTPPAGGNGSRADRARRGSRRRRDLDALNSGRELPDLDPSPQATEAWRSVIERAWASELPNSAVQSWIAPVRAAGVVEGRIALAAPRRCVFWLERRYEDLLSAWVRECSEFDGVAIYEETV